METSVDPANVLFQK